MNLFVFDIETIPDVHSGRKLYHLDGLTDAEVARAMYKIRCDKSGTEFLRHHHQQIVAISVVLRTHDKLRVWSLGEPNSPEPELIQRFFDGVSKYTPTLITWNGGGFDLPVLHYRALLHGISAPRYWENGDFENEFRWNNYLNRFHYRHMDLMDILAGYQSRASAPLDEIAVMLGLPGKMGMSGDKVWSSYQDGQIEAIRNYCETDVLNTYLVYLRFELMRGKLTQDSYQQECQKVRDYLAQEAKPHFLEFLQHWSKT